MKLQTEHFCHYIIKVNDGGWEGAVGSVADDYFDQRYVCCGARAYHHCPCGCEEYWLCDEHHEILKEHEAE